MRSKRQPLIEWLMTAMKLYELYLKEIKKPSQAKITRQGKINRAVGHLATNTAKDQKDPVYQKMRFHLAKYKEYKNRILSKYSSRVKTQARR